MKRKKEEENDTLRIHIISIYKRLGRCIHLKNRQNGLAVVTQTAIVGKKWMLTAYGSVIYLTHGNLSMF